MPGNLTNYCGFSLEVSYRSANTEPVTAVYNGSTLINHLYGPGDESPYVTL